MVVQEEIRNSEQNWSSYNSNLIVFIG